MRCANCEHFRADQIQPEQGKCEAVSDFGLAPPRPLPEKYFAAIGKFIAVSAGFGCVRFTPNDQEDGFHSAFTRAKGKIDPSIGLGA